MLACLGRQRHRTLGAGSISVASQDFKLHHSEMPQRMSSRATAPPSSPCPCRRIKRAGALLAASSPPPPERFVDDSPLEGSGFEPSVPLPRLSSIRPVRAEIIGRSTDVFRRDREFDVSALQ